MCPFKGDAVAIIKMLLKDMKIVKNMERFAEEYEDEDREEEDDFRVGVRLFSRK
jgi:hypothetical protein